MENEYYKEISTYEANERIINDMVDISDSQMWIISDKGIGISSMLRYGNKLFLRLTEDPFDNIIALKDEWFLFHYGSFNYLCDQFDGILKCLEDKYIDYGK